MRVISIAAVGREVICRKNKNKNNRNVWMNIGSLATLSSEQRPFLRLTSLLSFPSPIFFLAPFYTTISHDRHLFPVSAFAKNTISRSSSVRHDEYQGLFACVCLSPPLGNTCMSLCRRQLTWLLH